MSSSSFQEKKNLRKALRAARARLSSGERKRAGRALVRWALHHRLLVAGKRVGLYIPANGEIDVLPLLARALAMGVDCYLPVVPPRQQRKLWFSRLEYRPYWRLNRFDIPEYHPPGRAWVRATKLHRLFVPMLGFDLRGYRIGMGGGFYDASLAYLIHRKIWKAPALTGIAFSVQQTTHVPENPWDVPLGTVLTERGLITTLKTSMPA